MMNVVSHIHGVKSNKAKGLLRGHAVRERYGRRVITLRDLRAMTDAVDAGVISGILETNPIFRNVDYEDDFPQQSRMHYALGQVKTRSASEEISFQLMRIRLQRTRVLTFFTRAKEMNEVIVKGDAGAILLSLKEFRNSFGNSLFFLRKIAFLFSRHDSHPELREYCSAELGRYGFHRRNLVALSTVDMMGDKQEFNTLRKSMIDYVESGKVSSTTKSIVKAHFSPICATAVDFGNQILALGQISLIDVVLSCCFHRFCTSIFREIQFEDDFNLLLGEQGVDAWMSLSKGVAPEFGNQTESIDDHIDFQLYRQSIAWIELEEITNYRMGMDPLWAEKSSLPIVRSQRSIDFCQRYFLLAPNLQSLTQSSRVVLPNILAYCPETAGKFTRTLAFMHLLRSGHNPSSLDEEDLLSILNNTLNIAEVALSSELKEFFTLRQKTALTNYLAAAVIADSGGSSADKHLFRRVFQEIVMKCYDGDIIRFAESLFDRAPDVALHLFITCNEGFLSQLFILITDADMIYENRARLLEWFSVRFNEPLGRERAKALRIDQRLHKIRGDLDDTRLYVDPIRFSEWVQDNLSEELSSLLQLGLVKAKEIDTFRDFSDPVTNSLPHMRLAVALQEAFREFCENKRYGVESYIGRRIRHGTLKGVMTSQIHKVMSSERYAALFTNEDIDRYFKDWIVTYEAVIRIIGAEKIRVLSREKTNGYINPSIVTTQKIDTVRSAMRGIVKTYDEDRNFLRMNQLIYEYCWRLIEKDLAPMRESFEKIRSSMAFDRSYLRQICDVSQFDRLTDLCRRLDAIASEKFRTLAGWFTKPVNLSPSAPVNLLLEAVLSEVKEGMPEYHPNVVRTGLADVELVGMYYHHIYDFFYVVVHNAGKHGRRDGDLIVDLSLFSENDELQRLEIAVKSQIRRDQTRSYVASQIGEVMNEPIENAMVISGHSGIKKLKCLEEDVHEIRSIGFEVLDESVTFKCILILGRS